MKDLLSKMEALQSEAHMPAPAPMTPPVDKGNPVTMNVSLNASGKEHVEDLMDIVKNANIGNKPEPSMPAGPMRMDIDKFRDIVDGPKPDMDMEPKMGGCGEDVDEAEWDNSPDEEYRDTKYMTKDLAGGLNKEKRSYKTTNGADNPMALDNDLLENKIRAELKALYKL